MRLKGKKIVAIVDNDFEDLELMYPIIRLREEGADVKLAGPKADEVYKGQKGIPVTSDLAFADMKANDFDAIVVPGGWAPDQMRRDKHVLTCVKEMDKAEKPIAQICHAGWVLVSADVLKGKKMTSTPAIKDDVQNAGATWVDETVVVDGHLVSSRNPGDLPDYMREFIKVVENK